MMKLNAMQSALLLCRTLCILVEITQSEPLPRRAGRFSTRWTVSLDVSPLPALASSSSLADSLSLSLMRVYQALSMAFSLVLVEIERALAQRR